MIEILDFVYISLIIIYTILGAGLVLHIGAGEENIPKSWKQIIFVMLLGGPFIWSIVIFMFICITCRKVYQSLE
jgi:hypothetical protein